MTDISLRQYAVDLKVLMDHEALEEAIGHCQHILKFYPKNVATYRTLGWALLGKARFDQAGEVFRRVLGVDPGDKEAHRGLSMVHRDLKNWVQAIWHMERAFEQDPNNVDIQKRLRELYALYQDGDYGKLQLTRGALARMYLQSGLHEKAITELQNALHDHPDRIDLRVLLARALWESTYPIEAGETATEVIRVLPYCLEANRILASLWLKNGRPSDAQPFLARVEAVDPYAALDLIGEDLDHDPFELPRLDWNIAEARQVASQTPDWVQSITDALQRPEDVQLAGDQSVPDWMRVDSSPAAAPARADVSSLFDSLDANQDDEILPDWMSQPAEDSPAGAADLDWMSAMQGNLAQPGQPDAQASDLPPGFEDWAPQAETPPAAAPRPAPPLDELDFLNEMEAPAVAADWLQDARPEPDQTMPATPDWLANLGVGAGDLLASAEPESQPETPATPDWFADVQAAAFDSGAGQEEDMPWQRPAPAEPIQADWPEEKAESSEEHPVPRLPVEPGQRVPTGFTGLLSALKPDDEDNDPLAWMNVPDARVSRENAALEAAAQPGDQADQPADAQDESMTAMLRQSVTGASSLLDDSVLPAEAEPAPAEDPLAWLQIPAEEDDLQAESQAAQPQADSSEALAWLYSEDESAILDEAGFEVPLEGPAAAAPDNPLAWLQTSPGGLDAGTDKDKAMTPSQPEPGPADWQEPEADDWLDALGGPPEPESEPEPEAANLPDWLAQAKPAEPAQEDVEDDWLAGINIGAPDAPAGGTPEPELGWLSQMNLGDEPATGDDKEDVPAWLQGAPDSPTEDETPDWLGMGEPAPLPSEPVAEPTPEIGEPAHLDLPDTPDWLNLMDTGEEPAPAAPVEPALPAAEVPDWLSEMAGDEAEPVPAEPVLPAAEVPDWLSEMAPEPPVAGVEETPEPEFPVPAAPSGITSWLDGIRDETPAAAVPETDWLGALSGEEEEAAEEPIAEAGATPDWLSAMAPAEEEAAEEPIAEAGATPDWLSAMAPAEEEPAEEPVAEAGATPDWLSAMAPAEEEPAEEPVAEAGATPDWLSAMGSLDEELEAAAEEVEAEIEELPVAEAGATPDWLSAMGSLDEELEAAADEVEAEIEELPVAETGATPDWLSAMAPAEQVPAEPAEEPVAEAFATPDWLSTMGSLEEELEVAAEEVEAEIEELPVAEAGATPDWLSAMGSLEEELETAAEEVEAEIEELPVAEASATPDWLSAMAPVEEEPAEEPVAEAGATPDWLSAMGSLEEELETAAEEVEAEIEELPVAEAGATPDWLSAMAPAEPAEEPVAEAGATPDWLSAMGSLEKELETAAEEVEAEIEELPVAETGATPDWLSAMGSLDEELEAAAEEVEAEIEELPVAETGATPDWLSAMAPPEPVPAEEEAAVEEEPALETVSKRTPMPLGAAADAGTEATLLGEQIPAEPVPAEEEAMPLAEADPARWAMREVLQAQVEAVEAAEAALEEPAVLLDGTQPVGVDAVLEAEAGMEAADLPAEPGDLAAWLGEPQPVGADADLEAIAADLSTTFDTTELPALVDTAEAPAEEYALLDTAEEELAEFDLVELEAESQAEPVAEAGELPDWLAGIVAPAEEFAPLEPAQEELAEFDLEELEAEPQAEPVAEAGELPDWLAGIAAPAEEFAPLEPAQEELAEFDLEELEAEPQAEPVAEAGELPDWLSESALLETVETAPVQEAPGSDIPSVVTGEKVTIHDTLEWLSDMGALEAETVEGQEEQPQTAADTGPGWLRDVGMFQPEETPEVTEEVAPEPEPAPVEEDRFAFNRWVPVWMRGEAPAETPPASSALPDTTPEFDLDEDEDGPSWLRPVMEEEDDDLEG